MIYADCVDAERSVLLGCYKTLDDMLDALNGVMNAIESGSSLSYHMPAADAVGTTAEPDAVTEPDAASEAVEPAEAIEAQADVADVPEEEPAATDDVPPAQPKKRGRPVSGKFAQFCDLYPGYLRGEYGVTSMARELECSTATVHNYLRRMRELVELSTASDND
ncbi:MAG: hypothetical protein K2M42_09285 [Oscillospiraceae bacterium]|nr:hypothetical protein [Oscillospiraceae bacterium]